MVFFKAEANNKIGSGHLQRSLALASELANRGINASFIFADSEVSQVKKVEDAGFFVHKLKKKDQFKAERYLTFLPKNSLIVFDTDDERFYSGQLIDNLRLNLIKTACYSITDLHKISTDIFVNPNIISQNHQYKTESYTKKLLGTQYLIFRKEFRDQKPKRNSFRNSSNLLLILGNADPNHLSLYFLDVLEKIGDIFSKINLVVGLLNPDLEKIKSRLAEINNLTISMHIDAKNMIDLYSETDLAITAAGMAMWEMALFSIPQMVIASSEREKEYSKYLSELNYIVSLDSFSEIPEPDEMAGKLVTILNSDSLKKLKTEEFKNSIDPNGIKNIIAFFLKELNS
ncbi:MAG: hypothetical protein K9H49_15525 [Bacteroidales bacterium]|nr:hypothetical protein [Bacteroidales bacterium]MCF8405478.1 hypothetical protein [Bacteroidales bacterium]